jgi:ADP-ribose pyrophosphatase YjhB (NUDIX family)
VRRINLATGLLRRNSKLLLVQGKYAGEPAALWTLPGGRQEEETLAQTVVREFLEETSLEAAVDELAYVSESVDRTAGLHVVNCTFWVRESDPRIEPHSNDPKVVDARFVEQTDALQLLRADVLCIPVAAALDGTSGVRYFSFDAKDIIVPFFHG